MFSLPHLPGALPALLSLLPRLTFLARLLQKPVLEAQCDQGTAGCDEQTEHHKNNPEYNHHLTFPCQGCFPQPGFSDFYRYIYLYTISNSCQKCNYSLFY